MGVTDWGEINQPLGAPALGGAGGWADSVAQALNNSDTTVDARLATLEAAMEALIDAADANADGRVAKTGDTMTGPLAIEQNSSDPQLTLRWNATQGGTIRPGGSGEITFRNIDNTASAPITIGEAESASHAATKGYVDQKVVGGSKNVSFSAGAHTFNPGLTAAPAAFVITQIVPTGGAANATANFAVAPGVTATSATIYCNVGGSAYTGAADFSWIAVLP